MPSITERQAAHEALKSAYLANLVAESDAMLIDSDTSSSSDESSSSSSSEDDAQPMMSEILLDTLGDLYSRRYLNNWQLIEKTPNNIFLLLHKYRVSHPEIFRSYMRVTPECFDAILAAIHNDPIFHNNSQNEQHPVDEQLAIALYRFGHFGNAASSLKVALWAGVGYGTVDRVTKRVMTAVCREGFRRGTLHWADEDEKEAAKAWVEENSCPAWRDGWLMVDGTLVPLFARPGFYGNTWYDRKSNYSMNIQLISMPNLLPIDYEVGLPGSQHDTTAWAETRVPQEHVNLLPNGEWVWGDSAYPLQTWCQAPYKKPEKDTYENTKFNYHVSKVRIRSEHCIGFLKGRWSSLCGLRISINENAHIHYASLWITSCIILHTFAMQQEAGLDMSSDEFYLEGLWIIAEERELAATEDSAVANEHEREAVREVELLEGKLKREMLKKELFAYLY